MGTLNEKLDYLSQTKEYIKEAIISKGQEVSSSDTFRSYASKISAIDTVNNENLTVNPTTSSQTFTPAQGYTGFGEVSVDAVTSTIDSNIQAENIKQGVEILGVTGEYEGAQINNQDKTVTANGTYTADSGYTGLGEVTVALPLDTKTITINGTYNASSDDLQGYSSVTVNVADIPAVVEEVNVIPTTSAQTIRPEQGIDGFSVVNVSAVTSVIDNNITAENIVDGVQILGVSGSAIVLDGEEINITPTTSQQVITPTSPRNGITQATVAAVDHTIDANIIAGNIKSGVEILGVEGTYSGAVVNNQNKNVTPSTSAQEITADNGYTGLGTVNVSAVTSSIDENIQATNIVDGVTILGVTGSAEVANLTGVGVNPSTEMQNVRPEAPYNGFAVVDVFPVDATIDENIQASNIKSGVTILGVTGDYQGTVINNQNKSVIPSAIDQSIVADVGYTGLGTVTVSGDEDLVANNIKSGVNIFGVIGNVVESNTTTATVTPTTSAQMITPESPYNGFSSVTVDAVTSSIDSNISAGNIKSGVEILGVEGTLEEKVLVDDFPVTFGANTTLPHTVDFTVYPQYDGATHSTFYAPENFVAENIKSGVKIMGVTGSYEGTAINNENKSITVDGTYTAGAGYTGLGTVTVTAGSVAATETQNKIAEQLMVINDGPCTLTVTMSPSNADLWLRSETNSVNITPTSSSGGVYIYTISIDPLKEYSYIASAEGYVKRTGTIVGGTTSSSITLDVDMTEAEP